MSFGIQVYDASGSLVFDETYNTFKSVFYTSSVITAATVVSVPEIDSNTQIAFDANESALYIIPEVTLDRNAKTVTVASGGGSFSMQFWLYNYK